MNPQPNDFMVQFLICPLSGKLFETPIVDVNGVVYEQDEYTKKFGHSNYYVFKSLQSFINTFLDKYPEFKNKQYHSNANKSSAHSANVNVINKLISSGDYSKLKNYTLFSLKYLSNDELEKIMHKADETTLKYFIDNTIDMDQMIEGKWYFINYMCNRIGKDRPEIIKYCLEKHKCMKLCCGFDGWYPLHQIIHFSNSLQLHTYAIDKHLEEGLDLFSVTNSGESVIEYIFKKEKDIIEYAMTKINMDNASFKNLVSSLFDTLDQNSKIDNDTKETLKQMMLI